MAYISNIRSQANGGTGGSSITTSGSVSQSDLNGAWLLQEGSSANLLDFQDDFMQSAALQAEFFYWKLLHAATNVGMDTGDRSSAHPGQIRWGHTGNGTSGLNSLPATNQGQYILGNGVFTLNGWHVIDQASTGGNTYIVTFGLSADTFPPTTNGVWLSYTNAVNGGDWVLNAISGGTTTTTNSTTAFGTGQKVLQIVVNAAATSVNFLYGATYAALSSMGTVASNIPTSASNPLAPFFNFQATNRTGTMTYSIDLITCNYVFTTPR